MNRSEYMQSISELSFAGTSISKLDHIGVIYLNGRWYFNVFRRYNSIYEIVLEDFNGDFYFHKDYKVCDSIRNIMCLSRAHVQGMQTYSAFSVKHASSPDTLMNDIPMMRWSEVQSRFHALVVDFSGILDEPRTLPVSIPVPPQEEVIALPEGSNLSERFQKRTWSQLCGYQDTTEEESDEESNEECDGESDEECDGECDEESDEESEEDSEYDSQYEWSSEEEPDVLNLRNGKQVVRS